MQHCATPAHVTKNILIGEIIQARQNCSNITNNIKSRREQNSFSKWAPIEQKMLQQIKKGIVCSA